VTVSQPNLRNQVMALVLVDAFFRRQLLADPRLAIEAVAPGRLPATVAVRVFEETLERLFVLLPHPHPFVGAMELAPGSGPDLGKAGNLMVKLTTQALADPGFRAELVADPRRVIETLAGGRLPETVAVQVLEESPEELFLVLPYQPAQGELADQDLETVAGGISPTVLAVGFTVAWAATAATTIYLIVESYS